MAIPSRRPAPSPTRKTRRLRWIALLAASALLHLFIFNLVESHIGLPSLSNQDQTVITTALLPPMPPMPPIPDKSTVAPPAPPKKPQPKPKAVPREPKTQPVAVPVPEPEPPAEAEAPEAGIEEPTEAAAPQPDPAQPDPAQPDPAQSEATQPETGAIAKQPETEERVASYKVNPPPSAELKYDVLALRKGESIYGSGKIKWQTSGASYAIHGEASILFFTLLEFESKGVIDDSGVAPVIYSEKRVRRSQTNTHFHRERNTISFSASTNTYPRKGGEQDRASIIWQLAGIGRGDEGNFTPGAELDIFVAGVHDAETWRIRVLGKEDVEVDGTKTTAWHVVRNPRPGSYDQKLDIWLAPDREWYPVKLRYTETNGDYLELALSKVNPVTTQ